MKNNNIIPELANALALSNRMEKKFTISGEHIGATNIPVWHNAMHKLHGEAYKIVCNAHNNDLTKVDETVDKTSLYGAIREILALIGEVNGHKLACNEHFAIIAIAECAKSYDEFHGEALTVKSQLTNVRKQIRDIEDITEGINKEYRENLFKQEERLANRLAELKAMPDMVTCEFTKVSDKAFRSAIEHALGAIINGQKMKTWEELEAEAKAKKEERNRKTAERRKAKKAEEVKKSEEANK